MFRRVLVLGLVVTLVATLAAFAAVRTSSSEVQAQAEPVELTYLCLDPATNLYRAAFTPNCPPNQQLLTLPDDYPISLCASTYDGWLRAPGADGQCQAPNTVRVDLPDDLPVEVCYYPWTGLMRLATDGTCTGRGGPILATFGGGAGANDDTYQTLGNVDIDVPAGSGVLDNDFGPGITVTGFQNPSANGGTVNVNPDGSFTYIPPVPDPDAFTGTDTFTYDVLDTDGNTDTATVTIEVLEPVVWFVDEDALAGADNGLRVDPFDGIEPLNDDGNDPDNPGDVIFLFESVDEYDANFHLEKGQYLIGQEVDLGEILRSIVEGSALMGRGATGVLPFMVLPETNPTPDVPVLVSVSDFALEMDDDSTAIGLVIEGDEEPAVLVDEAENTTLDRVEVYGGVNDEGWGEPGVIVDFGSLTVIDSYITGGDGDGEIFPSASSSSLQGLDEGGTGGDGIVVFDGEVTITGSTVEGGDSGGITPVGNESETTLQGLDFDGGDGGNGIFVEFFGQITITGGSTVSGGNGGFGFEDGGDGGDGIQAGDFFLTGNLEAGSLNRNLQGRQDPPEEEFPSITVSGASLVEGGNGGDGEDDDGGDGGSGIATPSFVVSVSEGSTINGGHGGSGEFDGGFGGHGIGMGAFDIFESQSAPTLMGIEPPFEEFTILSVDASFVHGGNGGVSEDFAGYGGQGVLAVFVPFFSGQESSSLQGESDVTPTLIMDVTGSEITGGNGADALGINGAELQGGSFGTGGDGGSGIVFLGFSELFLGSESTLQGSQLPFDINFDINVTGSDVAGGTGGSGFDGGWGGWGIANGFPFFLGFAENETERPVRGAELQGPGPFPFLGTADLTIVDSTINAGAAGDGDDFGGFGGVGVASIGDPFFSDDIEARRLQGGEFEPQTITTISNSTVNGASGGNGPQFEGGWGGDGLVALGTELLIDQGSQITAGDGGDGDVFGGDGGFGIYAELTITTVDASTVTAGTGGDGEVAGLGGEGIAVFDTDLTVSNGSQVNGGAAGTAADEAAPGGDGVLGEFSTIAITDSTVNAGTGGAGTGTDGERGGHGVHIGDCIDCLTLTITDSTVNGGDGGGSDVTGGDGGEGVMIENENATITGSTITGGHGVDGGEGQVAVEFDQEDDGTYVLILTGNTLIGGTDGNGQQSDSLFVQQDSSGSVCMDATGNVPTGAFELDNSAGTGTLGITQASVAALGTDNNGVTVDASGTITTGCSTRG